MTAHASPTAPVVVQPIKGSTVAAEVTLVACVGSCGGEVPDAGVGVDGGSGRDGGNLPDGGVSCTPPTAQGACDTHPQCGCANAQSCLVGSGNDSECAAVGSTPDYAKCTGTGAGQCMQGLGLHRRSVPALLRKRRRLSGRQSRLFAAGSWRNPDSWRRRLHRWMRYPVTPTRSDATHQPCGPGVTCALSGGGFGTVVCTPATGTGTQGAACDGTVANCAPGFACAAPPNNHCYKYCYVGLERRLLQRLHLRQRDPPTRAGTREVGVCFLP